EGKKYFPKRIRQIILDNQTMSMAQMYQVFKTDYIDWLGEGTPIDDVLMIGIRL
ncbi:MAG: hypothetical protein GX587_04295, partial [Bacteroidales bacterium]|nr:hypothetical protein [Bacteroidales bacterium]